MTDSEQDKRLPDQGPLDDDATDALTDIINRVFGQPEGVSVLIPRHLYDRVAAGMKPALYRRVPEARAYAPLSVIPGGKKPQPS